MEVAYRGLKTVGGEEGGINVCFRIRAIDDCVGLEIWIRFQWNFILRANAEYFLSVRKWDAYRNFPKLQKYIW